MDKYPGSKISGNDRYQGYLVDLVDRMSKHLGFKYQIMPVKDGRYGHQQPDGLWNGMVGELMNEVRCIELHAILVILRFCCGNSLTSVNEENV